MDEMWSLEYYHNYIKFLGVKKFLYSYQQTHLEKLNDAYYKNNHAIIDGSDPGVGKTYTAIALAIMNNLIPFVICPKAVISQWIEAFKHFNIHKVNEKEGLVKVVNYELLTRGGKIYQYRKSKQKRFGEYPIVEEKVKSLYIEKNRAFYNVQFPKQYLVIFDEIQKCKNYKTLNTQLLIGATRNNCNIIGLSATLGEDPMKFYGIGYMLKLFEYPKQFWDWIKDHGCHKNYFDAWEFSGKQIYMKQLHDEIYPQCGARIAIKDLGDQFPDNQITAELYKLTNAKEMQAIYHEMKKELYLLKDKTDNYGEGILPELAKLRQEAELLKVPIFVELIESYIDGGCSVVVFLNYRQTLHTIKEKVQRKIKQKIGVIEGNQTKPERDHWIGLFQDNQIPLILCNIKAGGIGLSLHDLKGGAPRVSLISPTFSAQDLIQATGRIWRVGSKSKSLQRIIFVADTIEEGICYSVRKKINNINLLNDGDLITGLNITPQQLKRGN